MRGAVRLPLRVQTQAGGGEAELIHDYFVFFEPFTYPLPPAAQTSHPLSSKYPPSTRQLVSLSLLVAVVSSSRSVLACLDSPVPNRTCCVAARLVLAQRAFVFPCHHYSCVSCVRMRGCVLLLTPSVFRSLSGAVFFLPAADTNVHIPLVVLFRGTQSVTACP